MTVPAYVKFNSRERALSTDQNRQAILTRRAIAEAMAALATGTQRQSGCFGASFVVAPQAGTMKCSITPGLALLYDSTAVFPYSTMAWLESSVLREVTLDAGDVNPRYDVVEMRAGSATTLTQPRDEFNPLTGSFSVVNMAKEVASTPEFQVRKGTPAVLPSIPAGTSGWMPLAYVLVPSGALSLLVNNVVHCRPILDAQPGRGWTDPTLTRYASNIKGGGLAVAGAPTNAITVSTTTTGRFAGHHHDFRIEPGAEAGFGSLVWDGGGAPAVSGAMYFYAIPAPYPAGYDASMASREFWTPDATVVYGAGSGFGDAALQEGCIIIASFTPPVLTHESGHPAAGFGSINHSFFSSAPSLLNRSTWVYLGSASYNASVLYCEFQSCTGSTVATYPSPSFDLSAVLPINVATQAQFRTYPFSQGSWPNTALSVEVHITSFLLAGGRLLLNANDVFSDGGTSLRCVFNADSFAFSSSHSLIVSVRLDSFGELTIEEASAFQDGGSSISGRSYRDEVLSLRMG